MNLPTKLTKTRLPLGKLLKISKLTHKYNNDQTHHRRHTENIFEKVEQYVSTNLRVLTCVAAHSHIKNQKDCTVLVITWPPPRSPPFF